MKFQDEWSGSQFYRFPPSLDQADSYTDGKRQEKISIRVIFKGYKPLLKWASTTFWTIFGFIKKSKGF